MLRRALAMIFACLMAGATAVRAEPPPLDAYGALPAVEQVTLSASGKRAAFVVTIGDARRIAVQDVGGEVLATIDIGSQKLGSISFAGDDYLLISKSRTYNVGMDFVHMKWEIASVSIFNVRTATISPVFGKDSRIAENAVFGDYGEAKIDGRWYGFFGGITLAGDAAHGTYLSDTVTDLYRVDLETGRAQLAASGSGRIGKSWLVGPQGEIIAHEEYDPRSQLWSLIVGGGSGGRVVLSKKTPLNDVSLLGLGRTPGTVLVIDKSGDEDVLEEVSLADGKTETLWNDYYVRGYIRDQTTGLLQGAITEEAPGAILFDPALQAKVRGALKAFPGKRAHLEAYDPTFDNMVVFTDGGDDSGTYWFVDIGQHSAVPLAGAYPKVTSDQVGSTQIFTYKAKDGLDLDAVLTLPPGRPAKNLPVIVMPHGGPLDFHDEISFDWWAQAYASRGYAVLQPNFRGSSGHGIEFVHAGYGEWGGKMVTDVSDGLSALAAKGVVDPKRACIVGGSYGGYSALAGVTLQQGLYRCAVAVAGVSDLAALRSYKVEVSDDAMERYWKIAIKGEGKDAPGLDRISPAKLADRADAPVLLIHGKDDTNVPIAQSRTMESALRAAHKSVEMVVLLAEDHNLSFPATRKQMLEASVAFVEKYNPPN